MIARQAQDCPRLLQGRFPADIERAVAAPEPEEIGAAVVDRNRPAMDVGGPSMQTIRRLLITVEFRKISYVMRFIRSDIVVIFAMHPYVLSRTFHRCRDLAPAAADYAPRVLPLLSEVRHETEQ